MHKAAGIFLNALPVLAMIGFIPFVANDYALTLVYVVFIAILLAVRREKHDLRALIFGFFIMTIFEYLFLAVGVETFTRTSFLGVMPLWLPFLWAYGFVAIKRSIEILNR
ncbi:MAG: DUF2878 family protein [Patescibacteria group bacterium]